MNKTTRHPAVVDLLGGAPNSNKTRPNKAADRRPSTRPRPRRPRSTTRRFYMLGGGVLVALAVIGGRVALTSEETNTATSEPNAADVAVTEPETTDPLPDALLPPEATGELEADTCRTDSGDQKSGPGVIAAFEYAYYVDRSGEAARALATPESPLPQGSSIQTNGIDTVPPGTTHCVRITPIGTGVYSVALAEMRPGQPPVQFPQTITTKEIDGRWFIDVIR